MGTLELVTVDLRVEEGVGWVTLNRPEALNAWTRRARAASCSRCSTSSRPTTRCARSC